MEQNEPDRVIGASRAEAMRFSLTHEECIEFHIEGLIEAGESVPPTSSVSELIEVNTA